MKKENWIWMPHAGHFICGSRCEFKLNTYVGGYIVSTVGEMPKNPRDDSEYENIGVGRKYETMVFKAKKSKHRCCPWVQTSGHDLDFAAYNDAASATSGHMAMCEKWAKKGGAK